MESFDGQYLQELEPKRRDLRQRSRTEKCFEQASTFASPSFHNFPRHLETFEISLAAHKADQFDFAKRSLEYIAFGSKLDIIFFNHLSHVTSLTMKAPKKALIGDRSGKDVPLALRKDHMPHLKYVHLEHIIVSTELIDFLVGHNATLEQISLRYCFIDDNDSAGDDFYREHFFDSLYHAEFSNLRRCEISADLGFYSDDLNFSDPNHLEFSPLGPRRRLFAYIERKSAHGDFDFDWDAIDASLVRGRDQINYDRLMRMFDANATRSHP